MTGDGGGGDGWKLADIWRPPSNFSKVGYGGGRNYLWLVIVIDNIYRVLTMYQASC